jgi:hypothetical protein
VPVFVVANAIFVIVVVCALLRERAGPESTEY